MNNRERQISDVIDQLYSLADGAQSESDAARWRDLALLALQNGRIEHMDVDKLERPQ